MAATGRDGLARTLLTAVLLFIAVRNAADWSYDTTTRPECSGWLQQMKLGTSGLTHAPSSNYRDEWTQTDSGTTRERLPGRSVRSVSVGTLLGRLGRRLLGDTGVVASVVARRRRRSLGAWDCRYRRSSPPWRLRAIMALG